MLLSHLLTLIYISAKKIFWKMKYKKISCFSIHLLADKTIRIKLQDKYYLAVYETLVLTVSKCLIIKGV